MSLDWFVCWPTADEDFWELQFKNWGDPRLGISTAGGESFWEFQSKNTWGDPRLGMVGNGGEGFCELQSKAGNGGKFEFPTLNQANRKPEGKGNYKEQ